MFEPLFGNLFDLDGDGQATFEEELIGLHIMDEMEKARRAESGGIDGFGGFGETDDSDEFGDDSDDGF